MRVLVQALMTLVPPERRGDAIDSRRSLLLVVMLLLVIVTTPVGSLEQLRTGAWGLLVVSVSTVVVFSSILIGYRLVGNHVVASRLLLGLGMCGIVSAAWLSGGVLGPVAPMLIAIPLVAIALLPGREGGAWTLLTVTVTAALLGVHGAGVVPDSTLPPEDDLVHRGLNLTLLIGYVAGFVWFMQSVTELQVEEIEHQRRAASAASDAKSEFLANMSHELRTPMNGVLGMTHVVLADPDLSEENRDHLETVLQSGTSLVRMLDDILALAEDRPVALDEDEWDPSLVVEQVLSLFAVQAAESGLDLRCRASLGARAPVYGGETRVRQILMNLVGNAVKFTESGSVEVRVRRSDGALAIDVEDTGPGIEPHEIERLLLPFEQADTSVTRRHGGSGLGLALARRFAEQLGGTLAVRSAVGQGSCFTLTLPAPPAASPERGAGSRAA